MFDAMRAAGLSTEQTAALDRDADARTRARAAAVLGGVRVNLPRVPGLKQLPADTQTAIDQKTRAWEVSATPVIDRLATASMDDKAADRAADLKRKLLASQRSAVRDIATLLRATLRVCDPGPEERVSSSASSRHCLHCQAAPLRTPSADCSCRDRSPAPILRPS